MTSTPIAFPEVATALQTRVIDFAEGGINTFYHNKFYDIVKYVADVRHTHQAVCTENPIRVDYGDRIA